MHSDPGPSSRAQLGLVAAYQLICSTAFKLSSFVPPQVFDRYKTAQDKCAMIRRKDDRMMITVRFSMLDIVVLEKHSDSDS